jgi:hypothetical protein
MSKTKVRLPINSGLVKLTPDGDIAYLECIDKQHYLVWIKGVAVTEVMCVPVGSNRWRYRGCGTSWCDTRKEAIQGGRYRLMAEYRLDKKTLENWSAKAKIAIDAAMKGQQP